MSNDISIVSRCFLINFNIFLLCSMQINSSIYEAHTFKFYAKKKNTTLLEIFYEQFLIF